VSSTTVVGRPLGRLLRRAGAAGTATGRICFTQLPKSDRLPEAHTCFNTVDMPDYNDYAMMRDKLMQSIDNDDGKFDLI